MKKILIAVCDTDGAYGERLGEWISLENKGRFLAMSFSSPECLLESLKGQTPDIVLLGSGFLEHSRIQEVLLEQRPGGEHGLRQKCLWMYLRDAEGEPQPNFCIDGMPLIEKYQPASRILRDIFSYYQSWAERELEETDTDKEVIGVYSPGHSIWQTPFALAFAQALGQREKVLYVSLKECAGFSGWFQEEYEKDLLDVMYLCLSNQVNVFDCVSGARYTMEGIDYIPPAKDGGCLSEISPQDYLTFVRLLTRNSGYDVILLDFGMMIPGFYQLLGLCSRVYITTEQGEIQDAPLQQFRQMTSRQENLQLNQKMIYLSLPTGNMELYTGAARLQQWLWGTMGDYSRRLAGVQSGAD